MKIRRMARADLPKLSKMAADIFREPYPRLVLAWLSHSFRNRVEGACLVAEENREIAGAIFGEKILTTYPGSSTIKEFFVAGKFRGRGVGKALMKECLLAMKGKGTKNVSLLVREKNSRALSLYRKIGFKPFRMMLLKRF